MSVNDINSIRKLIIAGKGWNLGELEIKYIMRHACSSAILDEEDFEWEEDDSAFINNKYLSFNNSMNLCLKNLDNFEIEKYYFRDFKKLGIYKGRLNPEDLILTNSFEKIPKTGPINHSYYEDEDYYLQFQESWKGIYGEYTFKEKEIFNINNINILIKKLNTGGDFYEWGCSVIYEGKEIEETITRYSNRTIKLRARVR